MATTHLRNVKKKPTTVNAVKVSGTNNDQLEVFITNQVNDQQVSQSGYKMNHLKF